MACGTHDDILGSGTAGDDGLPFQAAGRRVVGQLDLGRPRRSAKHAAITLAILAVVAASLRQRRRDHAIEVILEGREDVQIAVVQRERGRLRSTRTRRALARSFTEMVNQAAHPQKLQMRGSRPLYHLAVVALVTSELLELVSGLEAESVSTIGLARAERLITDAMSPLYGLEPGALRTELRRIISQLGP
jgi:hypothetical protein